MGTGQRGELGRFWKPGGRGDGSRNRRWPGPPPSIPAWSISLSRGVLPVVGTIRNRSSNWRAALLWMYDYGVLDVYHPSEPSGHELRLSHR